MNQYQAYDVIKQLYYPDKAFNSDEEVLKYFASPEEGIGRPIEFPDRISNVNGVHNYKLISSKDINFNNVLLPNSAIPDSNWGSFDEDRRWASNYPVRINDVYELMNVVDYLLCATEDLWDEINRLRYGSATLTNLWFLNNVNGTINSINKISSAQFTKTSTYAVLLNPRAYYTILPKPSMEFFGIGTHFYDSTNEYPILRRVLQLRSDRNGINGDISYEDYSNYTKTVNENLDGRIVPIYSYKIGSDLHFYPMFDIENYTKGNAVDYSNYESLIDYTKMKLKYDVYFRVNNVAGSASKFKKVYIDFLYNNWAEVGRPFILYFIDDNNKRQIIYIHVDEGSGNKTVQQISTDLLKYNEYVNNFYDTSTNSGNIHEFGAELDVFQISEGLEYPYLYNISDTSQINLFVQTPNTANFTLMQSTLQIPYFKNNNALSATINLPNGKTIYATNDGEQQNGMLYSPQRYNVPDNTQIDIDVIGTFLDYDQLIKYDDEFIDILLPSDENNFYVHTDAEAQQYYYYNGLDNNGKRKFVQFETAVSLNSFFVNDGSNSITTNNIDGVKCAHIYKKNEDAYKLKFNVTTNSMINQISDYSIVTEQSSLIENTMSLSKTNNKYTLSFNYDLPNQVEQVKFDLNLYVDETSKAQSTNLNIPISFNKIHQPCIQFISKEIMNQEIKDYNMYLAYTFGDRSGGGVARYKYTNKVIPNSMPNSFLIYGEGNSKTNQNIIQGTTEADQFNNFQELYTYVIERKYNNFEQKDYNDTPIRVDILANIDQNNRYSSINIDQNLEATFNKKFTYDNTIESMRDLVISYHPDNSILNIIGGGVFENYLTSISDTTHNYVERQALAYFEGITYSPVQGESKYITFKSIFNINGLGFNYRLHGGDSYLYINKEGSGISGHNTITDLPFNDQYDLLSNGCTNQENNIIKFMEISVTDNENQLEDMASLGSEIPNNSTLFLDNNIFEIHALSYESIVQKDFYRFSVNANPSQNITRYNVDNYAATYYTPITYINIKSTTFYPDKNILPDDIEYDLTDDNVVNDRYSQYIEYWNSNEETNGGISEISKCKPITMTIKLHENLANNTPFFYESNDAKLKFNIVRVDPETIEGVNSAKYTVSGVRVNLAINERYYLSEFIKVNSTAKKMNSIGSYPEYDEDTEKFEIKEFYYNTINDSTTWYPTPIWYNNSKYQYDIKKIAALNKIHFKNAKFNDHDLNSTFIDQHVLYYFDANLDNLRNLLNGDNINSLFNDSTDGLKLILDNGTIYGNKTYQNLDMTGGPQINVKFVNRVKPTSSDNPPIVIDNTLSAPDNRIPTNVNGFAFHITENGAIVEATFKHYQFYSLSQIIPSDTSHELLEVPSFNNANKIYIYSSIDQTMKQLSSYKQFANGITNSGIYTEYYKIIKDAFVANTIYERLT